MKSYYAKQRAIYYAYQSARRKEILKRIREAGLEQEFEEFYKKYAAKHSYYNRAYAEFCKFRDIEISDL